MVDLDRTVYRIHSSSLDFAKFCSDMPLLICLATRLGYELLNATGNFRR